MVDIQIVWHYHHHHRCRRHNLQRGDSMAVAWASATLYRRSVAEQPMTECMAWEVECRRYGQAKSLEVYLEIFSSQERQESI